MNKLIGELHKIFDIINDKKYNNELIPPVITVQRNTNKKKIIYGWCSCQPRWIRTIDGKENNFYEINISCNRLSSPYEEIVETLIHEIVHLSNAQKGIDDCNPRSQKHNEEFKKEAERVGLLVTKGGRTGYSQTSLSGNLFMEILAMDVDKTAFNLHMIEEVKITNTPKPRKPSFKYRCTCCNKEIKTNEEQLVVMCVDCDSEYVKISK